eukprot:27714-Eustigmatos_ZCMA.PRE.2
MASTWANARTSYAANSSRPTKTTPPWHESMRFSATMRAGCARCSCPSISHSSSSRAPGVGEVRTQPSSKSQLDAEFCARA